MMREQTTFLDWDNCQKKLPLFITDLYEEEDENNSDSSSCIVKILYYAKIIIKNYVLHADIVIKTR